MYNQQMMGQMGQMGVGMQQMPMGQPMMQPMAPMHSPWVMYYNQQGQPYYYNEQTGALSGFALGMIGGWVCFVLLHFPCDGSLSKHFAFP